MEMRKKEKMGVILHYLETRKEKKRKILILLLVVDSPSIHCHHIAPRHSPSKSNDHRQQN